MGKQVLDEETIVFRGSEYLIKFYYRRGYPQTYWEPEEPEEFEFMSVVKKDRPEVELIHLNYHYDDENGTWYDVLHETDVYHEVIDLIADARQDYDDYHY